MVDYVYKHSCGDYFPKSPNEERFQEQLEARNHVPATKYLYVDKNGIQLIGLLEKIWEVVRGFFGFVNRASAVRVNSEIVKLLYYGEVHGYMEQSQIFECVKALKKEIDSGKRKTDKKVQDVVEEIFNAYQSKVPTDVKKLRQSIVKFHEQNASKLRPGFWYRLVHNPNIVPGTAENYGSTHLQLAESAITYTAEKKLGCYRALRQYQRADSLRNCDPTFQDDFRQQFKHFVESQWAPPGWLSNWSHTSQKQKTQIRNLSLSLTRVAKRNKEYSNVVAYASFGLSYFPDAQQIQALQCGSKVRSHKYDDAFSQGQALETEVLRLESELQKLLPEEDRARKLLETEIKEDYEDLGDLYSHHKPSSWVLFSSGPDYEKASQYLLKAWQYDPENEVLEVKVFQTLMAAAKKEGDSLTGKLKGFFGIKNGREEQFVQQATEFIDKINVDELKALIQKLEELDKHDKAIHFYDFAAKKYPGEFNVSRFTLSVKTYYSSGMKYKDQNQQTEAFEMFEKATILEPDNKIYKRELFAVAKQLGEAKWQEEVFLPAYKYFLVALKSAESPANEREIKKKICRICDHFANHYISKCLVPYLDYNNESGFREKWKEHKSQHAEDLKAALKWYNNGLKVDSKIASLHFDKAELIEYFELAGHNFMEEYKLAVEYNDENPFYLMRLAEEYSKQSDDTNYKKYRDQALQVSRGGFGFQFSHWFGERFVKSKVYNIKPHFFSK